MGRAIRSGAFLLFSLVACNDTCASKTTSRPTTTTTTPTSDAAPQPGYCPHGTGPMTAGIVEAPEVNEISGIVSSKTNPDTYWVHNDSGDSARAFALSDNGALLASLSFDTARPTDIEDVAIEDRSDGKSFLYFADIGDNESKRTDYVIHRVAEPKLAAGPFVKLTAESEKMHIRYPDGAHDAETLLFDPITKDLLVVTKVMFGKAEIHRVGPFVPGGTVTTTKITTVPILLADAGDISRDGRMFAIRNYSRSASLWIRAPGEDLATMFGREACQLPLGSEPLGEAFGFFADGTGYVTISEGKRAALHVVTFE